MRSACTVGLAAFGLLLAAAQSLRAQATPHYLGSITAISGDTLTVKTDQGDEHHVQVPSTAQLKRIAPGQTDLSKAETIDFSSLALGDRVLVNIDPNATGGTAQAARVIAIKHADVTKMQEAEAAAVGRRRPRAGEERRRGKRLDHRQHARRCSHQACHRQHHASTTLKRYASGSVNFSQAQPAPISAIQPGDQIFVRGARSADGTSIAAQGVVSGSFRSIAGTVISTDASASTVTVKDLATKKPVTVHVERRCPVTAAR